MKHTLSVLALSLLVACTAAPSGGQPSGTASLETYANDDIGYTIDVPSDWTITESDTVVTDGYTAVGTSFGYPAGRDRSALGEATVNVASMPECPSQDGGTMDDVNGQRFMRTEFDGVGAGNRYRGETYAIERGGSCVVVTLFTHSCNLGPDCGDDRQEPYSYDDTLFKLKTVFESLTFR